MLADGRRGLGPNTMNGPLAWDSFNTLSTFTDTFYDLKVHKIENFFGSDFEFCTISLLVMFKY